MHPLKGTADPPLCLAPGVGGLLIIGQDFRWVYLGCGVAGILTLLLALYVPLSQGKRAPGSPPAAAVSKAAPTLRDSWQHMVEEARYVVRHRGILMTSLAQAAQYFAFGFLEVYLPLRLADAGWTAAQIGLLFTVQVLVTTLTKPLLGRLTDRFGRVALIVGGMLTGATGLIVIAIVQSYALLLVSSGLFGLGLAAVTAATAALVTDLAHESAYGAAMGVLSSIMDVGQSTGPMLGGLLAGALGYFSAFASVAALMALTAVVFPLVVHER
jgi:sugar phosphate permease